MYFENMSTGRRLGGSVVFAALLGVVLVVQHRDNHSRRNLADTSGTPKMCRTPSGYHPCECLHTVPSGTRVEDLPDVLRLHHPDGSVHDLKQCPHSPPPQGMAPVEARMALGSTGSASNVTKPCNLDWPHAAPLEAFYEHSKDIAEFSATYTVPQPPTATADNILYYWIGLQDLNSTANPVIQPVLSYVRGSASDNWYFASWNCCPKGHKLEATQISVSGPGEKLRGTMAKDPKSGVYTVTSANEHGESSVLISDDTNSGLVRTWNWVDIVLETYNVADCAQYSAGGDAGFLSMKLIDVDGAHVTPTFSMAPYIDGHYLPPKEAQAFTACCSGQFRVQWPDATMAQNAD